MSVLFALQFFLGLTQFKGVRAQLIVPTAEIGVSPILVIVQSGPFLLRWNYDCSYGITDVHCVVPIPPPHRLNPYAHFTDQLGIPTFCRRRHG